MRQIPAKKDLQKELEEKLSSIQVERIEEEAKANAQKVNLPYINLSLLQLILMLF